MARSAQHDVYHPIEMLDFDLERELLHQCFSEASKAIDVVFDTATTHRLRSRVTVGTRALHYSGHGHPNYLTFEDGKGGLQFLSVDELKTLVGAGEGGGAGENSIEFVFVR